jgi:hypothetical protein
MRILILLLALSAGQMNTLQDKPVVHLRPRQDSIPVEFGGDLLVLLNGPSVVHLPNLPPALDSQRRPWSVYVENLGPGTVTIVGGSVFDVAVSLNQTIRINSNGREYTSER